MSRRFIFYLVFMSLFFVQTHSSWGTTVLGGSAGNGEDSNAATFHFNGDSVDFQMTKPDGTSLVNGEMAYEYGQSFEILKSGADYIVPRALQVTGANLSGSNWTTYAYPPYNHVALDPATGRIKFSTQSAWQEAEGIDINEPYPFFSNVPDVETSDAGYAIAAWDQEDASYVRVWANVYSPQSGWYGAVTIDADTGHTAGYPVIAMNSSGQAICTFWQIDSGGVGRVYVVHYQPGVGWYGRVTVNAASGYDAFLPDVAMNDAGQAICVFFQSDATASRIYATRYVPNVGWYTAVTIQVYNNNYGADYPRIAINDAGYALCAFLQPDATTTRACANRYVPGAGWQGAVAVDNGSANPASEARAAINDNNQGFVFFEQTDPSGTPHQRIYVNEYTSSWLLSPYAIDDANLTTNAGYPEIASNNSGQLVCVFNQTDAVTNRSYANRYQPGVGWYGAVTIDAKNGGNSLYPHVAINDAGQILASYYQVHGAFAAALVSEYLPGTGWKPGQNICREDEPGLGMPNTSVALNNAGFGVGVFGQNTMLIGTRMFATTFTNAVPYSALEVNYNYQPPTPTPTSSVPVANRVEVKNRKIEPLKGEKVVVEYALREAGLVSIKAYNLRGELAAVLQEQHHAAGSYSCQWGGETLSGALAASGVYVIHIKTPSETKTQKVVVIK